MQGWKTILFNGVIGLVAILAEVLTYLTTVDWKDLIPPDAVPYVVLGIGVANIVLRHLTSGPAGWLSGQAQAAASQDGTGGRA